MISPDSGGAADGDQTKGTPTESDTTQVAIDRFHQILGEKDVAQATRQRLVQEQRTIGLLMQGRPLTQVLRPRLISGDDHGRVCSAGSLLAGALQRLAGYAVHDGELGDHIRQVLALSPLERSLTAMSPPMDGDSPHSRLDGFFTTDHLSFVEYNADSPMGPLTQEALAEIFVATPAMQTFTDDYRVQASPARQQMVDSLTHVWRTGGMPGGEPRIAIVECGEPKFSWEFNILRTELRRHGVPAVICSVDDLRYEPGQGGLYVHDAQGHRHPITIVYRRATLSDLSSHYGATLIDHPLTRAWSTGGCVMVNSFSTHLANKKSALALLTDPRISEVLSPQEVTTAEQHLPWTRLVRPGPTTYHGDELDLLTFACAHRENLVLKPNDDYGGQGIVCGWQVTGDDWEKKLTRAMNDSYVIQERIIMPEALYPTWGDGRLNIEAYHESTDPFLFASTAYGCICRLSPTALINVSTGGTCVPVFQVKTRA